VVKAAPGGAGGGGATLTPFGAEVLERYNRILDHAASLAADDLTALARRTRLDAGAKV
jgi:molybdate transport system regulatory protein